MLNTTFKDFIGNPLNVGDYCAYPGAGNTKAEYGLILYKITGFDEAKRKVKAIRLSVDYAQGAMYDTFHPLHLKNAIVSTVELPDHYSRNGGKTITGKIAVRWISSSLENTNKLVLVKPNSFVRMVFDAVTEGDEKVLEAITVAEIGSWILGSTHVQNPFCKD